MATVNVLSAARTQELLNATIVKGEVVGDDLILTTMGGEVINAGNVRGAAASNPTALATAFSPTAGIVATNVQTALAELGGDVTNLTNNKADKTAIPIVRSGRVTQPSTANTLTSFTHTNVFDAGVFTTAPDVVVMLSSAAPNVVKYYSIEAVTTRSFTLNSMRTTSTSSVFHWIAVG